MIIIRIIRYMSEVPGRGLVDLCVMQNEDPGEILFWDGHYFAERIV
jgi:hypothetical protein